MRLYLLPLLSLSLPACGSPGHAQSPPPTYTRQIRTKADSTTDVVSVSCQPGEVMVGGGCKCSANKYLWGARPVGNGYLCSCGITDPPGGTEASVVCLASNVPGTLIGITMLRPPDPEQAAHELAAATEALQAELAQHRPAER